VPLFHESIEAPLPRTHIGRNAGFKDGYEGEAAVGHLAERRF
jgi:hypothetical protein